MLQTCRPAVQCANNKRFLVNAGIILLDTQDHFGNEVMYRNVLILYDDSARYVIFAYH